MGRYHACLGQGCPRCYEQVKRVCPRCLAEKTDKQWYGSACFKGTCKPARIWDETYFYELEHRRPKGTDWRYIGPETPSKMRGA